MQPRYACGHCNQLADTPHAWSVNDDNVCFDCFEVYRIQVATNMRAPRFKIEKWQQG